MIMANLTELHPKVEMMLLPKSFNFQDILERLGEIPEIVTRHDRFKDKLSHLTNQEKAERLIMRSVQVRKIKIILLSLFLKMSSLTPSGYK